MAADMPDVSFVKPEDSTGEAYMLWREQVANVPKHWVRLVTACSSKCLFCLDGDTPRNLYLSEDDIKADLRLGREQRNAWKVILSGGEASLHPQYTEFIRYAHAIGYGRVQTVTNGWRYADPDFYEQCIQAGLGEITFSLHGHTAELHNRLTRHKGAFERIVKAIRRAARDPRVICSVDVVINKQNVGVLDKIVQLAIKLGVTEFDLLHVIPQAWGFDHRDELFYDPRPYLPVLRKVFRLNRHPRFVVWTNRFPVAFLEDMEDLIQDPHKMIDEVLAIHYDARRYLDTGANLDCRQPERCEHCFIEPYCTTMDRAVTRQNAHTWEVWDVEHDLDALQRLPLPLPYGIHRVGLTCADAAAWHGVRDAMPEGAGVYLRLDDASARDSLDLPDDSVVVARTPAQCEAWLSAPLPEAVAEVEIHLTAETARWMADHTDALQAHGDRLRVHQPSYEHMKQATANDVRRPRAFFAHLDLPLRVSGLPICQLPGATWVPRRPVLPAWTFSDATGRFVLNKLAKFHIIHGYEAKSSRCEDCVVADRCDGMHINMIRDQGLKQLQPLVDGPEAEGALAQLQAQFPTPPRRIRHGRPLQPPAPSLPGYAMPSTVPRDPLEVLEEARQARRAERLAEAKALFDAGDA